MGKITLIWEQYKWKVLYGLYAGSNPPIIMLSSQKNKFFSCTIFLLKQSGLKFSLRKCLKWKEVSLSQS